MQEWVGVLLIAEQEVWRPKYLNDERKVTQDHQDCQDSITTRKGQTKVKQMTWEEDDLLSLPLSQESFAATEVQLQKCSVYIKEQCQETLQSSSLECKHRQTRRNAVECREKMTKENMP